MNIKFLLKKIFMKLIPVKNGRMVFTSFNGHYSDSPKYLCDAFHSLKSDTDIIWLVDEKYEADIPEYAKTVLIDSFKGLYYYASANIIIDNVYGGKELYLNEENKMSKLKYNVQNFLNHKKNQFVYTTWHGMPIKKMGRDQINSKKIFDFSCPNTTMIVNDKHTYEIMNHINFEKINMKLMGCPRNDILYISDDEYIKKMKEKLKLPLDKKIIMFAPTFRSDSGMANKNIDKSGKNQLNEIDFDKLFQTLTDKFSGEWVFVCRFHYHVEKLVDWDVLKQKYGERVINGNANDDIMEYLVCSDVLLSDISSAVCDFFITEKPVFCFFPDYIEYKDKERGLYISMEELPFEINEDFNSLIENIKKFDMEVFLKEIRNFKNKHKYIDDKNSSITIAKYILEERKML